MTLFISRAHQEMTFLLQETTSRGFGGYKYNDFRTLFILRPIDMQTGTFEPYPVTRPVHTTLNRDRMASVIQQLSTIYNPYEYESALKAKDLANAGFNDTGFYLDIFRVELDLLPDGPEYRVKNMSGEVLLQNAFTYVGE